MFNGGGMKCVIYNHHWRTRNLHVDMLLLAYWCSRGSVTQLCGQCAYWHLPLQRSFPIGHTAFADHVYTWSIDLHIVWLCICVWLCSWSFFWANSPVAYISRTSYTYPRHSYDAFQLHTNETAMAVPSTMASCSLLADGHVWTRARARKLKIASFEVWIKN